MKLLLVKAESLRTSYDNKKTEIEKYLDNLDFKTVKNEEINVMKKAALLLINEEEIGFITLDYKNRVIEYKNNIENLIATKMLKKEDVMVNVMSNRDEFIRDYNAIESKIESELMNSGFINWKEKTNIKSEDWSNIDFLEERIELSSFNDVYKELLTKKNKVYLSTEFIEAFVRKGSKLVKYIYFEKLNIEELKSDSLIKSLENYNGDFFFPFFNEALKKENKEDKELIMIIKTKLINENNIEKIVDSKNIKTLIRYIPNKLINHEHIISSIIENMNRNEWSNEKININELVKIIGKNYFKDKKDFIFFMSCISEVKMENDNNTNNFFEEIINSFDLKKETDKKLFTYLYEETKRYEKYRVGGFIIKQIAIKNIDYLTDKEKIMLDKDEIISLNKEELLNITEDESNMLIFLKGNSMKVKKLIIEKAKDLKNLEKLAVKENIVHFLKIAFPSNWLKSEKVPKMWKNDNILIINTYGIDNYKDMPIEKRKEIEESKENIIELIKININNFKLIKNDNKFDINILKNIAENSWRFKEVLEDIPSKKWHNFNFCLKLLEYNKNSLKYIPKILFNNKQFVLNIFEMYENNENNSMTELLSEIPEELKSFLQNNNINLNYVYLLNKHFEKDNLELILTEKNERVKVKKI